MIDVFPKPVGESRVIPKEIWPDLSGVLNRKELCQETRTQKNDEVHQGVHKNYGREIKTGEKFGQ